MIHSHYPTSSLRGLAPEAGDLAALRGNSGQCDHSHIHLSMVQQHGGSLPHVMPSKSNQATIENGDFTSHKSPTLERGQYVKLVTSTSGDGVNLAAQSFSGDLAGGNNGGHRQTRQVQGGQVAEQPVEIECEGQAGGLPVNFRSGSHTTHETARARVSPQGAPIPNQNTNPAA
jgi:hypothetical protein